MTFVKRRRRYSGADMRDVVAMHFVLKNLVVATSSITHNNYIRATTAKLRTVDGLAYRAM